MSTPPKLISNAQPRRPSLAARLLRPARCGQAPTYKTKISQFRSGDAKGRRNNSGPRKSAQVEGMCQVFRKRMRVGRFWPWKSAIRFRVQVPADVSKRKEKGPGYRWRHESQFRPTILGDVRPGPRTRDKTP